MRIITGTHKGRRLKTPKDGAIIRPALSQVREAIFSSLGDVSGLKMMDVFAGTGSLGLEALSRGCDYCWFVDQHPQAIRLILENLQLFGLSGRAHVYKRRLPHGLTSLKIEGSVDVVFCDPPYDKNLVNPSLALLVRQNYVAPRTLYIVEHSPREIPAVEELQILKTRVFGQTRVSTLCRS